MAADSGTRVVAERAGGWGQGGDQGLGFAMTLAARCLFIAACTGPARAVESRGFVHHDVSDEALRGARAADSASRSRDSRVPWLRSANRLRLTRVAMRAFTRGARWRSRRALTRPRPSCSARSLADSHGVRKRRSGAPSYPRYPRQCPPTPIGSQAELLVGETNCILS